MVDRCSQAANPRLEKTTYSRSPQMQKSDVQEINEDIPQTHKIYHFQNCGTVYMDSFNARGVRMKNCGNNVPQVTYHCPRIIGNEKVPHSESQSHAVINGMWALAPSAIKHVGYVLPPLLVGPQNATGPPIAPTEIAKSNPSNMHLQTNSFSPLKSRQRISPAHFSGDHAHHNAKYLEQLLDSSLATAAVIQFSGNTLADVLTPRAYDTFKALYALAALDTPTSSTKRRGSEIPSCSTFLDIGNDCPYSSHCSPTLPNSSLAVPYTGKIHVHISFSVDYIMFFSWVRLAAAVSCLAVICLGFAKGSS